MAFHSTRSSTDRLRRVQNILCFGSITSTGESNSLSGLITACNNASLQSTLRVGNPVAILVWCDSLIVLAVTQVNQL